MDGGGVRVLNRSLVDALVIPPGQLDAVVEAEEAELRQR